VADEKMGIVEAIVQYSGNPQKIKKTNSIKLPE
jgi:hypothetical protein